jgi:hypothetical protein
MLIADPVVSDPAPNMLPARYAVSASENSNSFCFSNRYFPNESGISSPRACVTGQRMVIGSVSGGEMGMGVATRHLELNFFQKPLE